MSNVDPPQPDPPLAPHLQQVVSDVAAAINQSWREWFTPGLGEEERRILTTGDFRPVLVQEGDGFTGDTQFVGGLEWRRVAWASRYTRIYIHRDVQNHRTLFWFPAELLDQGMPAAGDREGVLALGAGYVIELPTRELAAISPERVQARSDVTILTVLLPRRNRRGVNLAIDVVASLPSAAAGEEASFALHLDVAPEDATTRLVYADWLEEQGRDLDGYTQRWIVVEKFYPQILITDVMREVHNPGAFDRRLRRIQFWGWLRNQPDPSRAPADRWLALLTIMGRLNDGTVNRPARPEEYQTRARAESLLSAALAILRSSLHLPELR